LSCFFSCKKNASDPSLTSAAKGGGTTFSSTPVFDLTLPDADVMCETSSSYCFNTSLVNHGGQTVGGNTTIHAEIYDATNTLVATSANLEPAVDRFVFQVFN
jgi:hypothetical protein